MASKSINELDTIQQNQISNADSFVLEHSNVAMRLQAQTFIAWAANALDGHGGIYSFEKTATVGLVDTYTMTMTDGTTVRIDVSNGERGETGQAVFTHIKYAERYPLFDADLKDAPDEWMGIYTGTSQTAPTTRTSYLWYKIKGDTGEGGAAATIAVGTVTTGAAGTQATVTNSGSSTAAVFDFVIPRGTDGTGAGTVTSVGIGNGGGLSVSGSPITSSGTITVGHSNQITAQTTQAVYPVTIDANGHITSYGNAISTSAAAIKQLILGVSWWEEGEATYTDDFFAANGYAYIVTPQPSSIPAWENSQVYADNVTVSRKMTFHHRGSAPTEAIYVWILRMSV